MNNYTQNYDFENLPEQQNSDNSPDSHEDKTVNLFIKLWAVSLGVSILSFFAFYLSSIIIDDVFGYTAFGETIGNILSLTMIIAIISHHLIAIIGRIKYPHNNSMKTVFSIDITILIIDVIIVGFFVATKMICDAKCGDCG